MTHRELEYYLARLEKALGQIAISEKAEIITEIKSHVMEALDNEEGKSINDILHSLGEPEQVASRYLIERGLKPQRPPKHPVVKWLTIGFLGTFAMMTLTVLFLAWKFTPLIKVDEASGRVKLLGGMIDINESSGSFSFHSDSFSSIAFSGEEELDSQDIERVRVDFSNGNFAVKNTAESKFIYNCKIEGTSQVIRPQKRDKELTFSLEGIAGSKCELELPSNLKFSLSGMNGKVTVNELKNDISVKMANGKIGVRLDPNSQYRFNTSVVNGRVDHFPNSEEKQAFNVELKLTNGKISQL